MKLLLAAALVLSAFIAPSAHAAARTESKTYVGGAFGAVGVFCEPYQDKLQGGACFNLQPDDGMISVSINEPAVNPVPFVVTFYDAAGSAAGSFQGCGSGTSVVPRTATEFDVFIDSTDGSCLPAGPSDRGVITVSFTPLVHASWSETQQFVAGSGLLVDCPSVADGTPLRIGGGCFDLRRGDTQGTFSLSSQIGTAPPYGFSLQFADAAGNTVGDSVAGCTSVSTTLPPTAVQAFLFSGMTDTLAYCQGAGVPPGLILMGVAGISVS